MLLEFKNWIKARRRTEKRRNKSISFQYMSPDELAYTLNMLRFPIQ